MSTLIFKNCGCSFQVDDRTKKKISINVGDPLPPKIVLDIHNIDLKCPLTWALFAEGRTKGIFQLETDLGRVWSEKIRPMSIQQLGAVGSLLRPGCLRAYSGDPPKSMTQRYADRRNRVEDVVYLHPALKPILEKTYGVLVYQEQSMKIASEIAGFTPQEADVLRKAIGKKKADIMAAVRGKFLKGCQKKGLVNEAEAIEIFGWIRESQRYSFCRSHADCYAKNGYWSAYCKAHFPLKYYCAWLRGSPWKQDRYLEVKELINEAKLDNIDVNLPNILHKKPIFYIDKQSIYFGLGNIRDVGSASIKSLLKLLNDTLRLDTFTWLDFLINISCRTTLKVVKGLIQAGALDTFGVGRKQMLYEYSKYRQLNETEKNYIISQHSHEFYPSLIIALERCQPTKTWIFEKQEDGTKRRLQTGGGGCSTKARSSLVGDLIKTLKEPTRDLIDDKDWVVTKERDSLGVSITYSKVDAYDTIYHADTTCKEFVDGKNDDLMNFIVEISTVKVIKTKRGKNPGQEMAILAVEDGTCVLSNVLCFPDAWYIHQHLLQEGRVVHFKGARGKNNALIMKKISQLN